VFDFLRKKPPHAPQFDSGPDVVAFYPLWWYLDNHSLFFDRPPQVKFFRSQTSALST
jgi:hypothetical protein